VPVVVVVESISHGVQYEAPVVLLYNPISHLSHLDTAVL